MLAYIILHFLVLPMDASGSTFHFVGLHKADCYLLIEFDLTVSHIRTTIRVQPSDNSCFLAERGCGERGTPRRGHATGIRTALSAPCGEPAAQEIGCAYAQPSYQYPHFPPTDQLPYLIISPDSSPRSPLWLSPFPCCYPFRALLACREARAATPHYLC